MYWDDLNKDNIELAKELYYDYLQDNKDKYSNQLLSFEEYLENEVVKCARCETPTTMEHRCENGYLCNCCHDDNVEYDYIDPHDEWMDYQLENNLR